MTYPLERDNSINNYANNVTLSEDKLRNGLDYLKAIDEWCKKNGKEFYYVIVPDKNKIYGEYYRLIRKQHSDEYGIGNQFTNYIKKNSDIKVIYLYDILMQNKDKGILYFKHDTHWNDLGAYYGYKALVDLMNISPKSYEFDERQQGGGDLENMAKGVINKDNEKYKYSKLKNVCKSHERKSICKNDFGNRKLFMLRDSFGGRLILYLGNIFNEINTEDYMSYQFSSENLKFIKDNADIVILENAERYVPVILNKIIPQNLIKEN